MRTPDRHRGFTLIEVLVAIVIGMIATLIIFQVFAVTERQKRTTTGTSDAQGNGAISISEMQRDIEAAGWGLQLGSYLNKTTASGCDVISTYDATTGAAIDTHGGTSLLQAVTIADGGAGPDSITLQYYDTPENSAFSFGVASLNTAMTTATSHLELTSSAGCSTGSLLIIGDSGSCSLMQVSAKTINGLGKVEIAHDGGGSLRYNPPTPAGWPVYSTSASVQCFPAFYQRTYGISARELTVTDNRLATTTGGGSTAVTNTVASGIMDLQAEYGVRATATSPIVWVNATTLAPTTANIRTIVAVRIALVARSSEYQKPADGSTTCDATDTTAAANWSSWAHFTTSGYPADWQCYRYKEFETIIPLRNAIWAGL